jgi:hypothetical protein
MNAALEAALHYHAAGLSVVPTPNGVKGSRMNDWSRFADQPADDNQLKRWYRKSPNRGIALIGGVGGLCALDIETRKPPPEFEHVLDLATPIVKTGRGWHVWFQSSEPLSGYRLSPDVELRGYRQLIMAPPSTHPSGAPYAFLERKQFGDVSIMALPPEWCKQNFERPLESQKLTNGPTENGTAPSPQLAREIAAQLGLGFPDTRCPFHDDRTPSAGFFAGADGQWTLRCRSTSCGRSCSLVQLWLWKAHGITQTLHAAEFGKWSRRLMIETGSCVIDDELPPLPPGTFPASVVRYWDGYRLLVRCDRATGSTTWPPFTHSFAERWCGMPRVTARRARDTLMQAGWLRTTGEMVTTRTYDAHRFQPGPSALRWVSPSSEPSRYRWPRS